MYIVQVRRKITDVLMASNYCKQQLGFFNLLQERNRRGQDQKYQSLMKINILGKKDLIMNHMMYQIDVVRNQLVGDFTKRKEYLTK